MKCEIKIWILRLFLNNSKYVALYTKILYANIVSYEFEIHKYIWRFDERVGDQSKAQQKSQPLSSSWLLSLHRSIVSRRVQRSSHYSISDSLVWLFRSDNRASRASKYSGWNWGAVYFSLSSGEVIGTQNNRFPRACTNIDKRGKSRRQANSISLVRLTPRFPRRRFCRGIDFANMRAHPCARARLN